MNRIAGVIAKSVKDLRSLLIVESVLASAKLLNVQFRWSTDSVVIESRSKAVILSKVEKTMGEQRDAGVACNCVGLGRSIAESAQYSDSAKRLTAREFASDCPGVILYKQILGDISNREPTICLVVNRHTLK